MKYIDVARLAHSQKISYPRLDKIIKDTTFGVHDFETSTYSANSTDDVYLEEMVSHDDIHTRYTKVNLDSKATTYSFKDKATDKTYLLCFKPTQEMAMFRSIKQKLADASTSYIVQKMSNEEYERFMYIFYTSINSIISTYARKHSLRIPEDVCFFYKGGNLYKILLNELLVLIDNTDFSALLKRSDADFQLFINPLIPNYKKVYSDLSQLLTFGLYSFKKYLEKDNFGISVQNDSELDNLTKEFAAVADEDTKKHIKPMIVNRSDYVLRVINIHGAEYVMYKEVPCILEGIPKQKPSPYYISQNTAIRFKRKDNTYNSFDLYRIKYNIGVRIQGVRFNVPSEVIDVGIPKQDDNTISSLIKSANKLLQQYHFKSSHAESFSFWGPTLNYMIKDIDLILFFQNEYPWQDKKTDKRVKRYFLCIILHSIISATDQEDPILKLNTLRMEFSKLIKYLTCFNDSSQCEVYGDENICGMFYKKYTNISRKLNTISNTATRAKEISNYKEFNRQVILILKAMNRIINDIISNSSKEKLQKVMQKVKILNETSYLGGGSGY